MPVNSDAKTLRPSWRPSPSKWIKKWWGIVTSLGGALAVLVGAYERVDDLRDQLVANTAQVEQLREDVKQLRQEVLAEQSSRRQAVEKLQRVNTQLLVAVAVLEALSRGAYTDHASLGELVEDAVPTTRRSRPRTPQQRRAAGHAHAREALQRAKEVQTEIADPF